MPGVQIIASFVALATISACATASVADDVRSAIVRYPIRGQTIRDLRDAIIKTSRALGSGAHGAASSSFRFEPELEYRKVDGGCILSNVRVRLDATITLPEWVTARGADEATVAAWRRFSRYVKAHEARHEAIAADYRRVMERELGAIGVIEDCPALGREALAVVADVERMHDKEQIAFDREERDRSSLLGR